jgi:hypothetical protein
MMKTSDVIIIDSTQKNNRLAGILAALFGALVFLRGAFLLWGFSFGFYRDSNLYVSLGYTLLERGGPFSAGVVTFPYPFLNAITRSWLNPEALVWLQIAIAALAAGFLVYVVAKIRPLLAAVIGLLLFADLVWGAINRNLMTEGLKKFCDCTLGEMAGLIDNCLQQIQRPHTNQDRQQHVLRSPGDNPRQQPSQQPDIGSSKLQISTRENQLWEDDRAEHGWRHKAQGATQQIRNFPLPKPGNK